MEGGITDQVNRQWFFQISMITLSFIPVDNIGEGKTWPNPFTIHLAKSKHRLFRFRSSELIETANFAIPNIFLFQALAERKILEVNRLSTALLTVFVDYARNIPVNTLEKTTSQLKSTNKIFSIATEAPQKTGPIPSPDPGQQNSGNQSQTPHDRSRLGTGIHIPGCRSGFRHPVHDCDRQAVGGRPGPILLSPAHSDRQAGLGNQRR